MEGLAAAPACTAPVRCSGRRFSRRLRAAAGRPSASAHKADALVASAGLAAASLVVSAPAFAATQALGAVSDASDIGLSVGALGAIGGLAFLLTQTDPEKRCGPRFPARLCVGLPRHPAARRGRVSRGDSWPANAAGRRWPRRRAVTRWIPCVTTSTPLALRGGTRSTAKQTCVPLVLWALWPDLLSDFLGGAAEHVRPPAQEVNKVQLDIRTGHAQTVEKVLAWVKGDGGLKDVTVCDAGCGTGSLAIPLALTGATVEASDISSVSAKIY